MSFDNLADVAKIYERDQNLKKEDISALSEWIAEQQHLPELTELQLLLFLHGGHYDVETTKITIEKYFTLKTTSELFQNPDEELIRRTLSVTFVSVLPKKTPAGYAIIFTKILDRDPRNYNYVEQVKVMILITCLYFHQYGPCDGIMAVFDVEGIGLSHFFKINFTAAKQVLYYIQEASPARVKAVHHINTVSIAEHAVALLKPFMKKELYNLMKFHSGSLENLYKDVPKDCLPQEYGGDLPSLKELGEKSLQNLLDHMDFLKWHDTQRVDESKRTKNQPASITAEKSAKKLEID